MENLDTKNLSESDLKEVMTLCLTDTRYLAKLCFPEDFSHKFTSLHNDAFDIIDRSKAKKICIAGARGFGKTTICEALVKKGILYQENRFIGYLSHSSTNAELSTESIKMDLLSNERLREIGFPTITEGKEGISSDLEKQFQFSKKAWVANGHTFILPRGAGQQVRGLKWIRYRPDLWIVDDLEDDQEIENEIQRDKLKRWFFGSLMKTVSRYDRDYRIIYIDTVKHEDALITHILGDPDWECVELPGYTTDDDGNYVTVDEGFLTQEELDKEVAFHRRQHLMDVLARELGCQPTSREDNEFAGYFLYYKETDEDFRKRLPFLENLLIVDPAKTKKMTSAQSGFLVLGVDVERGKYYVRAAFGRFLTQAELIETMFSLCAQYDCKVLGVEVTSLEEHITYPIKNYQMMHKKTGIELVQLKARGGKGELGGVTGSKVGRARGVIPLYQQGLIYHNESGTAELEAQALSFPRPKRWDVLDCAAYIPQMLEVGLRYIHPASMMVEGPEIEKEYEVLKNEPALAGDWKL